MLLYLTRWTSFWVTRVQVECVIGNIVQSIHSHCLTYYIYCCVLLEQSLWHHYGVGSWSLYTKQATPGSPPLLCRGHPTQSATSTMEPQGFQWALTQWRRSPVKVTRSPWDYFLKTQNGWQPTCVDMQNNVENVFVECTIYFLTIMQLTEAGLSIWQVQ